MTTVRLFPWLAAAMAGAAYLWPFVFAPLSTLIEPLLGVVMFAMGSTLSAADFKRILEKPRVIAIGVVLQFLLMPLFAFVIARALRLPGELAAGLILVGACPGGTASNVVCYLARGDVALSVTLTACTTVLAVVATPGLTWLYAGAAVPVPVLAMLLSILYVVLIPVAGGVLVNARRPELARRLKPALPAVSVAAIVTIIAIVVALNRDQMAGAAPVVAVAVMIHNLSGLFAGYGIAKLFRLSEPECRTIGIEVGMQNSGLGVALALKYFSPAAALPSAIFSIWHNLSGAAVASFWARRNGTPV
jgi:BASS family bile acid:Na+ symporter